MLPPFSCSPPSPSGLHFAAFGGMVGRELPVDARPPDPRWLAFFGTLGLACRVESSEWSGCSPQTASFALMECFHCFVATCVLAVGTCVATRICCSFLCSHCCSKRDAGCSSPCMRACRLLVRQRTIPCDRVETKAAGVGPVVVRSRLLAGPA